MRTAAYKVDVASDRRRRENMRGTFFITQATSQSPYLHGTLATAAIAK